MTNRTDRLISRLGLLNRVLVTLIVCFSLVPQVLAISLPPNQEFLAIHSLFDENFLYRIDPELGVATEIAQFSSVGHQSLAVNSEGLLYSWHQEDGLVIVDPETASTSNVNPAVGTERYTMMQSLAFSPSGDLYGVNAITAGSPLGHALYKIDVDSGVPSLIGKSPLFPAPIYETLRGIEFVGERLVGVTWSNDPTTMSYVEIDTTSGAVSYLESTGVRNMNSLAQDAAGTLYTAWSSSGNQTDPAFTNLYALDPNTGLVTDQVSIEAPEMEWPGFSIRALVVRTISDTNSTMPGDYNSNDFVDGEDLLMWQRNPVEQPSSGEFLLHWENNYGLDTSQNNSTAVQTPEPSTTALFIVLAFCCCGKRRSRR